MPEVTITIGGRAFQVACQEGEELYLTSAARMLDAEAQVLVGQMGRMPEARMLLMAGLMLADKTAGLEDRLSKMEQRAAQYLDELGELRNAPPPEPQRIEVPVVPQDVTDVLSELAARAESLANQIEEHTKSD